MIIAVADSTVIIHILRQYSPALVWINTLDQPVGVTPITWLEVMDGAGNKKAQEQAENLLRQFEMTYLTSADFDWAMRAMKQHRLRHGSHTMDCLIASVSQRLQLPLYTHNLKDMRRPLRNQLPIYPY
ncbi:MAG: hypothetical protein KF726_23895 [Anaerolineae bacterium]|nr:hypothetical protein [Anaerolineae bacterium]